MSKGGYPSVCVVDTHTTRPAVPPRLSQVRRRAGAAQTLLFLLVSVALCGMAIEACFIYRLYRPGSAASASSSKLIAGPVVTSPPETLVIPPSKPVAHLTDGQDVVHGAKIMAWSMDADPLLYEINYKDKSLVIQKEGYYSVYSKVSFLDIDVFRHYVNRRTERYPGGSIPLLMSRRLSGRSSQMRSNSYLAGVFHLTKGDALFVEVSNTSNIARLKSYENVFGAYMI
ncbi:tumor necrosis factor ligand superfamily member 14 [Anarrhichthys ocellatus]|uniref:tumor necrosis factor ligand superfamily member 14 n=1 Tax=Anarrhichthys ocellatus TaxID=433405 RepID=UPI0012EDB259|nr:tumor necrosis factor ligand superfamily member 14-like [Anarrhichthys ocellatus]